MFEMSHIPVQNGLQTENPQALATESHRRPWDNANVDGSRYTMPKRP